MDIIKAPRTIWFFSDPHFDHEALVEGYTFTPPSRPEFTTVAEMNEAIVTNHNALVRPQDHWYCLGDVAMDPDAYSYLALLNGHGRVILGNHDEHRAKQLLAYVDKVMAYRVMDDMLFSHIPIAPWSMRWRANVHGHCHLAKPPFYSVADPDLVGFGRKAKYINISVEHTRYRPVSLEQLSAWSRK